MRETPIPQPKPGSWASRQQNKPNGQTPDDQTSHQVELVEVDVGLYQEPITVNMFGGPGAGKSNFIGTAPGSIGLIPLEHKSKQSVLKAAAVHGKKVIVPAIDLIRSGRSMLLDTLPHECITAANVSSGNDEFKEKKAAALMTEKLKRLALDGEVPTCCQRCYYRWHVNRTKSVAYRMAERPDVKTIAIDTFGQLVDDFLFANYGRNEKIMPLDRKSFNQEVRDFINAIGHKHLILTHHTTEVWKDSKPTGRVKAASSFSKIGHFTSVSVELWKNDKRKDGEAFWNLRVHDCQANAELIGQDLLADEMITFSSLASLMYPDADPENWE